jgi:hypothetical protein
VGRREKARESDGTRTHGHTDTHLQDVCAVVLLGLGMTDLLGRGVLRNRLGGGVCGRLGLLCEDLSDGERHVSSQSTPAAPAALRGERPLQRLPATHPPPT